MEFIKLNNGIEMPMEGFGVFQVPDGNVTQKAVEEAIDSGYRLIDTAAAYMNEEAVGRAIAAKISDGTVKREDLFITTKVWVQDAGENATHKAFEASLKKLGLDYLDLYLIHQPMGDYYGSWRAMQQLYSEGRIKAIGVCNMYPHVLMDFCVHSKKTMRELGVVPEAWGPFAEGKHGIFQNPVIEGIAAKHGKTPAQAILRWNVQRGVVVIPKSVHKERMEQNINIWDFSLDEEDMEEMSSLDLGHSEIVNHCDPNFVKMVGSWKIH